MMKDQAQRRIVDGQITPDNLKKQPRCAIMSICSVNYFPYVRILFSSLKTYHPEASLFLCLADRKHPDINLGIDGVEIIEAEELGIPNFWDFAFRYDIMEFNTAIKPFMMRFLIEQRDFDQVIYLDPDIELFAPMETVFQAFEKGADFVLTPHLTAPAEMNADPDDIVIMKAGAYNLGFIAVTNSLNVIDFLHWWARRLRFYCINQQDKGLFVDQKFIDLLPSFQDNVTILRDPCLNVAYWNLWQRKLEKTEQGWLINGKPLVFFHFSGIDINQPHRLSKHTTQFKQNLEPALQALIDHYISQLKSFAEISLRAFDYTYGKFANGAVIADSMRRCYRSLPDPWFDNPFNTFYSYLNQPCSHKFANFPNLLTNLMYFIWTEREDLQQVFDLKTKESQRDYTLCFILIAEELKIDSYFVIPILEKIVQHQSYPRQNLLSSDSKVSVIGYLRAEIGVGQAGRMVARSLSKAGIKVQGYNVTVNVLARQEDQGVDDLLASTIDAKVHIYNVNADQLAIVRETIAQLQHPPEFIINMPFWELSRFPQTWIPDYQGIDEIWAASRFIQGSVQTSMCIPAVWMPPAVQIGEFKREDRSSLNLPTDAFLFHFNYDFSSYSTRKNPLAAIEAYRLAFRKGWSIPTGLVIKTRGYDPDGSNLRKLIEYTEQERDIFIIHEQMTYSQTLNLMDCCDCYVSLHRSEGFGYTLAEAMLLGKPVIATDYSGSKDFLNSQTGFPVKYQLKPLQPGDYPFWEGQKWADPDLGYAACLMRKMIEDEQKTKMIAENGRRKILSDYSPEVVGQRYVTRLRQLGIF